MSFQLAVVEENTNLYKKDLDVKCCIPDEGCLMLDFQSVLFVNCKELTIHFLLSFCDIKINCWFTLAVPWTTSDINKLLYNFFLQSYENAFIHCHTSVTGVLISGILHKNDCKWNLFSSECNHLVLAKSKHLHWEQHIITDHDVCAWTQLSCDYIQAFEFNHMSVIDLFIGWKLCFIKVWHLAWQLVY